MDWYSEIFILFDSIQFQQLVELLPTWINFSSESQGQHLYSHWSWANSFKFSRFHKQFIPIGSFTLSWRNLANYVYEICIYYQQRVFITWSFSYSKQLSVSPVRWWIEITNTSIHENEKSSISWPMVSKHI